MILWSLILGLALAQGSSDIEAARPFDGDREALVALLSDVDQLPTVFPETCTRNWEGNGKGVGSTFEVTYSIGWWKRRLQGTVTRADVRQGIEWEHHGNRGFITRWFVEPSDNGDQLKVKTWIQAPPWPFKKTYYKRIKPRWELCYRRALDVVAERL